LLSQKKVDFSWSGPSMKIKIPKIAKNRCRLRSIFLKPF
jgi:hypothetical protein